MTQNAAVFFIVLALYQAQLGNAFRKFVTLSSGNYINCDLVGYRVDVSYASVYPSPTNGATITSNVQNDCGGAGYWCNLSPSKYGADSLTVNWGCTCNKSPAWFYCPAGTTYYF